MVLERNEGFIVKEVKGEAFVLNVRTGDYFGLNEVGSDFIRLVDGRRTMSQIEDELLGLYDVDRGELAKDMDELAGDLCANGILSRKDA